MSEESNINPDTYRLQELETAIISSKGNLRKELRNLRIYILLVIVGAAFLVCHYTRVLNLPIWIIVICWASALLFFLAALGTDIDKIRDEVETNEAKKRILMGFSEGEKENNKYFDTLVKINVENLAAYYSLVKTHSSHSFKVSIVVSVFGFILIIIGLIISFQYEDQKIGIISTGTGLLIEFISGVLFYLYNKTVRQLKDYHDSLIEVQNVLLSFKLIEDTSDEKVKAEMITKMIEYLVGRR